MGREVDGSNLCANACEITGTTEQAGPSEELKAGFSINPGTVN